MASKQWITEDYAEHARFVSTLGEGVLEWLSPQPGERILDLGCGDGVLTARLVEAGAEVVGVDGSAAMVEAARAQVQGLDARVMNCEALAFEREFDAVFSNAAMHWMKNPDAVIEGVARALRPGGRFVSEFGGHGCVAAICVASTAVLARRGIDAATVFPWYFPTAEEYRERLEAQGFEIERISLFPRPTPLPTDMSGWLRTFADPFFAGLDDREAALAEAVGFLRPYLCDSRGRWTADYVRLRFAARL